MAGNRIEIMDLKQIISFKKKGHSNRKIASLLGVNRNTINTYVSQFELEGWSYNELLNKPDKELNDLFAAKSEKQIKRYEELASEFEWMSKELCKTGCTLQTLWEQYSKQRESPYSYTQYVHHYNTWAVRVKISGKLDHKAGEKLMIDYTGKKLHYTDKATGQQIPTEVYIGILPCSQYTYAEATPSQKTHDFILSTERCLRYFGGAPLALQPDCLKAAVIKADRYEPLLNKVFKHFSQHYGCVIDPARPYSPQDKALVENAVQQVYRYIFYPLSQMTFFSLEELNREIQKLLIEYNKRTFARTNYSRYELFISTEKQFLQPLPATQYEMRKFRRAKVQKMGHVYLSEDKHYYSVPHRYIEKHVEVIYTSQVVELYYNHDRIATHKRSYQPGKYSTIQDHLSSAHKAYSEWNLNYFQAKAKAIIGPRAEAYITKLILQHPYPEIGYKQSQGILQLIKQYDQNRVEKACTRLQSSRWVSYRLLETTLKNKMDQMEFEFITENHIPAHENIRGPEYYQ